jgi:glycosyltransferase involved in cell wall biosynthesis
LRVLVNAMFWVPQAGGAARYARELLPALLAAEPATRLRVLVPADVPADVLAEPWADEVHWLRLRLPGTGGGPAAAAARLAAQWVLLAGDAERWRADVVHGLANIAPPFARVPRVVTLLDLIWLRNADALRAADRAAMRVSALPSLRRATRVLAISEAVRQDALATLGLPASRVDVAPLAADDGAKRVAATPGADLRRALALGDAPVVLCVAQKRAHKNLAGLIRAFALLDDRRPVVVLPGAPTPHEAELRALASELGVADRVRFPGWLSDADLEGLYRLATCFVLPSFEEGFGLPILEAMARGVPVACSNVSSLPEVAGDAAEQFDPYAPEDIARAIGRILADPARRVELVSRGEARCREFTWERTARATLASYRRALAR